MREQGLLQPLVVRPCDKPEIGYVLVAGLHRLEAARALKWDCIAATVVEGADADAARLMEIDENLVRGELSDAERVAHVSDRKAAYERLHPETKVGKAPGKGRGKGKSKVEDRQNGDPPSPRFTKETAEKTGASERTIQRDARRGKVLEKVLSRVVGTSLDANKELDALVELPEDRREALIDRAVAGEKVSAKTEKKNLDRAAKEAALSAKQHALPNKRYGVIVADPPWSFAVRSGNGKDRSADNHYRCQEIDEIERLDVASIAADDCALFLWATVPMLPDALRVMAAWGFRYVSNFVWVKDRIGTGYWNRNRHELLLIGTRGEVPAPASGTQWDSAIEAPREAHSVKPERSLQMIESYFPTLPKIELHRRGPARLGWDAWGNEVDASLEPVERKSTSEEKAARLIAEKAPVTRMLPDGPRTSSVRPPVPRRRRSRDETGPR